jgi:hypothetical protein
MLEIQVLGWNRHKHVAGLNCLKWIPNFPGMALMARTFDERMMMICFVPVQHVNQHP